MKIIFANRSIAWQHFTAIPGDDSAECNICQKVIKMGASRLFLHFINQAQLDQVKIMFVKFKHFKTNLNLAGVRRGC